MSQNPSHNPLFPLASHVFIGGGTFTSHITHMHPVTTGGFKRTLLEAVAPSALHDAGHLFDLPKCHPGTRVAVIQAIIDWVGGTDNDTKDKGILWLTGAAGAGKTAIGKSVCDRAVAEETLLGSFFFRADDSSRNNSRSLIATIAYQICRDNPLILKAVSEAIQHDPLILTRSLCVQLLSLVIGPLSTIYKDDPPRANRRLIVIDGLDECLDRRSQRDILDTLAHVLTVVPFPIRFLVCSRPENEILNFFASGKVNNAVFKIFLGHEYKPNEDIKKFLLDKFSDVKTGHIFKHLIPDGWPSEQHVTKIVENSSGQFIYAATIIRYVEDSHYQPHQRLNAIIGLRPPFKDLPFAQLDALYMHILSIPGGHEQGADILAFPALYSRSCKLPMIETILAMEPGDVEVTLSHFGSIVLVQDNAVQLLHKSFADFLFHSQRSKDFHKNRAETISGHILSVMKLFLGKDPLVPKPSRVTEPRGSTTWDTWDGSPAFLLDLIDVKSEAWDEPSLKVAISSMIEFPIETLCESIFSDNNSNENVKFLHHFLDILSRFKDKRVHETYRRFLHIFCRRFYEQLFTHHSDDLAIHFVFAYSYLIGGSDFLSQESCEKHLGLDNHALFTRKDIRKEFSKLLTNTEKSRVFSRAALYCFRVTCEWRPESRRKANSFLRTKTMKKTIQNLAPWRGHRIRSKRYLRVRRGKEPNVTGYYHYDLHVSVLWTTRQATYLKRWNRVVDVMRSKVRNSIYFTYPISKKRKYHVYHPSWDVSTMDPNNIFNMLEYLPRILSLAGHYTPLVDLCRNVTLPAISILVSFCAKKIRFRIAKYLQENDPENKTWQWGPIAYKSLKRKRNTQKIRIRQITSYRNLSFTMPL